MKKSLVLGFVVLFGSLIWSIDFAPKIKVKSNGKFSRLVMQTGHKSAIWDVAYSNDGNYLLSASSDHQLKIWRSSDIVLMRTLRFHKNAITAVTPIPGTKLIATAAGSKIYLWNLYTGKIVKTFIGAKKSVYRISVDGNGRYMVTGGGDRYIRLWDLHRKKLLRKYGTKGDEISLSQINRQGTLIAAIAFPEEAVRIYHVNSSRLWRRVPFKNLTSFRFLPNGRQVVLGTMYGEIVIYDLYQRRIVSRIAPKQTGRADISKMRISADGKYLATVQNKQISRLFNLVSKKLVKQHTFNYLEGGNAVSFNIKDGRYAIGTVGFFINQYSLKDGALLNSIKSSGRSIASVGYSKSKNTIAFLFNSNVRDLFFNLDTGRVKLFAKKKLVMNNAVVFSPNGNQLFAAGWSGFIKWVNIRSSMKVAWHARSEMSFDLDIDHKGRYVALPESQSRVTIWSAKSGKKIKTITGFKDLVAATRFSPNGKYLAAASVDKQIRIYLNDSFRLLKVKRLSHWAELQSLSFAPNSKFLASCSSDRSIRIWRVPSLRLVRTMRGHSHYVTDVAYSPNGKLIASGSKNGEVFLWNAHNGRRLKKLSGLNTRIQKITFLNNGNFLLAVAKHQYSRIWNVKTGDWIELRFMGKGDVILFNNKGQYAGVGDAAKYLKFFNGVKMDSNGSSSNYKADLLKVFFRK